MHQKIKLDINRTEKKCSKKSNEEIKFTIQAKKEAIMALRNYLSVLKVKFLSLKKILPSVVKYFCNLERTGITSVKLFCNPENKLNIYNLERKSLKYTKFLNHERTDGTSMQFSNRERTEVTNVKFSSLVVLVVLFSFSGPLAGAEEFCSAVKTSPNYTGE